MDVFLLMALFLIAIGAIAGFLAGLLGIGGGVVLVPSLYYALSHLGYESDVLMHICVGTALAIIVPTGFASARAHWKKDAVDMALVKNIGIGILLGVGIGTFLANMLNGETLKMIFATALPVLALLMLVDTSRFHAAPGVPPQPWPGLAGTVIGTISTLIGIGGATLSVPFMSMCNVSIHKAIGTASALGLVISVPAVIGFVVIGLDEAARPPFSLGFVNLAAWAFIVPVSILVAPLGARSAHALPVTLLKRGFAGFIAVIALKMWLEILG